MRSKTAKLRAFEERHGRPAADVIVDAINRSGSVAAAAVELDLNYWTLSRWIDRLRIVYGPVARLENAG